MIRLLVLVYGLLAYVVGFASLVCFLLFVGGWDFFPGHIDAGQPGPTGLALAVNLGLITLFGLQHSLMARATFKAALTKVIPPAAERSTYILVSGILILLICAFWQPIVGNLWHIESQPIRNVVTAIQLGGWAILVVSSFTINHFELFGLQQVFCYFSGREEPEPDFTERLFYRIVRHPIQLGVLIGIWFTPTMSMTHLLLAATMTLYVFIGLHFEEQGLVRLLGEDYVNYQQRVRMLMPIPKRARDGG